MNVKNSYGVEIKFDVAANLMDDELREAVHAAIAPCSEQEFFDEYCRRYEETNGEPWFLDTPNPQY